MQITSFSNSYAIWYQTDRAVAVGQRLNKYHKNIQQVNFISLVMGS
ncbi:hypothetical protein T07_200 [Trichinella nelsoni]|uniref:Uncharacterized protein n=1 Tax=Trichinella nelsoni TaxID=6336 RepID=A0A0V0RAT6_9BILA|nr:hypothetical protein T07_200 [Trichinella nelsoni]